MTLPGRAVLTRRRIRVVAGLLSSALVAAVPLSLAAGSSADEPATATTLRAKPSVGSSSGGDPYFPSDGNGGYDVRKYVIDDTVRTATGAIQGWTRVRAVATKRLTGFYLDLVLDVDSVRVNGKKAAFRKPSRHELLVTPKTAIRKGATFTVRVAYRGRPADISMYGEQQLIAGQGEVLAVGQPQIGPWWFAANETPGDKALFDITLRVPAGKQAISNGVLADQRSEGGMSVWRWVMADPISTYLAFFAAGSFDVVQETGAFGLPAVYAVSKQLDPAARQDSADLLATTESVLTDLGGWLGDYPFAATGGVVTGLPRLYALETATRPVYEYLGGPDIDGNVDYVVHEQAHQWFGDDVALRRWRDIWLNEGFATYAEWWYEENVRNEDAVADILNAYYDQSADLFGETFWSIRIGDPGRGQMFSDPVYLRGAMTIAALRNRIGETDFETLIDRWLGDNAGGTVTTAMFRALAEEVSGEDLDGFFQAWLFTADQPAKTVDNGLVVP